MDDLISRQPEQRTLTEDDYAYCTECDHVEMCRWYPMYGCEFKSRPSAQPEEIFEFGKWYDFKRGYVLETTTHSFRILKDVEITST